MNKKTGLIIGFIIVAVVAFYAGNKYGSGKIATTTQNSAGNSFGGGQGGNGGQRGGRNGGGFTIGEIISKDATSITIKLQAGGSKIVFLGTTTKVTKSVDGTSDDLVVGKNVSVTGTTNPDGSVVADSVQIRPVRAPYSQANTTQ
jgi:hypothetical protein